MVCFSYVWSFDCSVLCGLWQTGELVYKLSASLSWAFVRIRGMNTTFSGPPRITEAGAYVESVRSQTDLIVYPFKMIFYSVHIVMCISLDSLEISLYIKVFFFQQRIHLYIIPLRLPGYIHLSFFLFFVPQPN